MLHIHTDRQIDMYTCDFYIITNDITMMSCIDLVFTNCLACWRMMLDEHPEQKTNHFASLLTNSWVALACFHIISLDLATEVYPLAAVMLQWREEILSALA